MKSNQVKIREVIMKLLNDGANVRYTNIVQPDDLNVAFAVSEIASFFESEKYNLVALRQAANEACVQAMAQRDSIKATVNWSNLYCAEARYYQSDDGSTGYEVTIEEADPNSIEFHNFIYDQLVKFGFPGVEIRMEW